MNIGGKQLFAPGVSLHLVGRAAFVLNEATQGICKLNTTGALIWCLCEDNSERDAVTSAIETQLSITRRQAEAYLETALAQWTEWKLVGTAVPDGADSGVRPGRDSSPCHDGHPEGARQRRGSWHAYVLGKCLFRILYSSAEQEEWGREVFGGALSRDDCQALEAAGTKAIALEIVRRRGGKYSLRKDNAEVCADLKEEYLIPALKKSMMGDTVQRSGCTFAVHAGVVHRNGQATILPAPSGSGKTTLVAGLMHAGFGYMSDEIALIGEDMSVRPLPVSLCIKQPAWRLVSDLYPRLALASTHRRMQDGNLVRYLQAPASSLLRADESVPLKRVIFPRYAPHRRASLRELEAHAGIEMLLNQSVLPRHLGGQAFDRALEKLRACRYYRLESPSLSQSIRLIESLG